MYIQNTELNNIWKSKRFGVTAALQAFAQKTALTSTKLEDTRTMASPEPSTHTHTGAHMVLFIATGSGVWGPHGTPPADGICVCVCECPPRGTPPGIRGAPHAVLMQPPVLHPHSDGSNMERWGQFVG